MNFKQKCFYMGLGCLFTLIGYTLATLNTDDTPSDATFDKIICRGLLITFEEYDHKTLLVPGEMSTYLSPGGLSFKGLQRTVSISDSGVRVKEGTRGDPLGVGASATLTTTPSGGAIGVTRKFGPSVGSMGVDEKGGGFVQLNDQHEKSGIQLSFSDEGGQIAIFNKGKQNVLQAGVHKRGGGFINTRDKNGYLTGRLP